MDMSNRDFSERGRDEFQTSDKSVQRRFSETDLSHQSEAQIVLI